MKIYIVLLVILFSNNYSSAQNNLPYPIIFVHGLTGSDETFGPTMEYLSQHDSLGDINVFDVVLNADNDNTTAILSEDVKWQDFTYNSTAINVGRRNYDADINNFVDGWVGTNIFAINFKEERIRGAAGATNDYFDQSNESAIFKQGHALGKMIEEVLSYTGTEKVILVGHSMGGLAIREYLQRMDYTYQHTHYIDPSIIDGHHVARVATYGTPHSGSNTSPDPTKVSEVPNPFGYSEANRDLIYEYNSFTQCIEYPKSIYFYGGNESCIQSVSGNSTFPNVDINCNGIENDEIRGINENFYSFDFNQGMWLPDGIDYTYMCSIWANWGTGLVGDGAVSIHRQWVHDLDIPSPQGLADTTMSTIPHTSEGADYKTILRGIDEPESRERAFKVIFNKEYIGYITYQQGMQNFDGDYFKIDCSNVDSLMFTLRSDSINMLDVRFSNDDLNFQSMFGVNSTVQTFSISVPNEVIYIRLEGLADSFSWQHPYHFEVTPMNYVEIDEEQIRTVFEIYPNPTSEEVNIKTSSNEYTIEIFSFDGKLLSTSQNSKTLDISMLPKGVYFLCLSSEKKRYLRRIVKN